MGAVMARRGERVCVLASGDPFLHGVGVTLSRLVPPGSMCVYPAPSAFSLAAARLGWPLQETTCLSVHGRSVDNMRAWLQPGRRLLLLTSGAEDPAQIAALLCRDGFAASLVTVLEALGGPHERIRTKTASLFDVSDINPLNVVAIEVTSDPGMVQIAPLSAGRPEGWFDHDGQITKRDIRAVTIAALQPRPGQHLWDIGAGSGAIAIEWMLSDPSLKATAIEANGVRAARIRANARRFGVPALALIEGRAPDVLRDLPAPDAVFIGGGGTNAGVMEAAIGALAPGGRLVVNAVTLELEHALVSAFEAHGGRLIKLNIAEAQPLGRLTSWRPALPVTQWSWSKP